LNHRFGFGSLEFIWDLVLEICDLKYAILEKERLYTQSDIVKLRIRLHQEMLHIFPAGYLFVQSDKKNYSSR
jgi:hypothetical protein